MNGSFHARLIYAGVQRADDEPLIGAFCAITKPPKDESVSYLMFPATKFSESRAEIIKRIEAYSVGTIESRMTLLSTQSANSSIVQAYQRIGEPLPLVGDVYCLRQDKSGYPNVEQYIQVTKVSSENRTFSLSDKVFTRTVVKMETSNKLKTDLIGTDYPVEGYANTPCKIRETHVADAGRYYGVKPITQAIVEDSQKIHVSTIMEKIVPVNQIETALVDMVAGENSIAIETAYEEVIINGVRQNTVKTIKTCYNSSKEDVTLANRSYNYTAQLINPRRGSVVAKFLSQGTWYELKDDGNGKLIGASQRHGSGSVNYETGSVVITCGELPDVNSAIVVNYSKDIYHKPEAPTLDCYLPIKMQGIGTDITITTGGKTARVVGNQIMGDFDGKFDLSSRTLYINPVIGKNEIVVNYQSGNPITQTIADNQNSFTLTQVPIRQHSLSFSVKYTMGNHAIILDCQDNGNGKVLVGDNEIGTVNYTTGQVVVNSIYTRSSFSPVFERRKIGTRRVYANHDTSKNFQTEDIYENVPIRYTRTEIDFNFNTISNLSYLLEATDKSDRFNTPNLTIDIKTDTQYLNIVDNTLYFALGNTIYQEIDKQIYLDGNVVGTRTDNQIMMTEFATFDGKQTSVKALLVQTETDGIKNLTFTTPKLRRKSLKLMIDNQPVNADLQGYIASNGYVDTETGLVMLDFIEPVMEITWQAVALSYLPVASSVLKIDTVRLPQDGKVPIFRRGDTILISNTVEQNLGSAAFTGGQTIPLDRQNLDRICLQDSNGKPVLATLWDFDLATGSITFQPSLDLSDYQMPLIAKHTQEERNRILETDIDGTLSLIFPTKRTYPIENTYVSSVLIGGDLQVRASVPFTQRNWNNQWQDTPNGEQLLNRLKLKDYPIILTDDGAITERWVIIFKSSSQFELYGETLGFVLKTDTLQDLALINPATNKPYFTIPKQAFGNDTPWATQDVIRFNTTGTLMPVWLLCAVQPTANPLNEEDGFTIGLFGDTTEN